jgi:hypothetical protein
VGQPQLRALLLHPELVQLNQRITLRWHIGPLSGKETAAYIRHRLRVAGATREIFTPGAMRELHRLSGGVPRIINVIADRALLGAYTREEPTVNGTLVRRAASEVYGGRVLRPGSAARDRRCASRARRCSRSCSGVPGPPDGRDAARRWRSPSLRSAAPAHRRRAEITRARRRTPRDDDGRRVCLPLSLWGPPYQPGGASPASRPTRSFLLRGNAAFAPS